jgi:hypothetical protein
VLNFSNFCKVTTVDHWLNDLVLRAKLSRFIRKNTLAIVLGHPIPSVTTESVKF